MNVAVEDRTGKRWYATLLLAGALGCSGLSGTGPLPPDVRDPADVKTATGAVGMYRAALVYFRRGMDGAISTGALLSDEARMLSEPVGGASPPAVFQVDSRHIEEGNNVGSMFADLHSVRSQAREARGFLRDFAPAASPSLSGHLYAIEAYMEIMLADLFCSGIPLSTLDYGADFTLVPGSNTLDVYRHALEILDTALALTTDSARFQQLAAVGRGRARLALREYAAAGAAVAGVPDDYTYGFVYDPSQDPYVNEGLDGFSLWRYAIPDPYNQTAMTMADAEGVNGLNYRSSGDPRTPFEFRWENQYGSGMYLPSKYSLAAPITVVIASGIEARLIQAEAALHVGGDGWLTILNTLRTDGTFETSPNASDPAAVDTLWHAGAGKVAGLAPLEDPGTFNAQVDLLFRERAFWLYYTGMRLGDMRRLIRDYSRSPESVFPTGGYPGGTGAYGTDVNLPVPRSEREGNPHYTGCIHRGA